MEGDRFYKVMVSPELAAVWDGRDVDCNRVTVEWGEPHSDGWYTPVFSRDYDDNPLRDALAEVEKLRWMLTHELDGWHTGDPKEEFELVEYDYHPDYLADLERRYNARGEGEG